MERFRTICAVIFKNQILGETDAKITLFSREYGTMQVIGRGVRSLKSRRRSGLQPLTKSTLLLEKHADQWYVREALFEKMLTHAAENTACNALIHQIIRHIEHLIPYETPAHTSETLFALLEETTILSISLPKEKISYAHMILIAQILHIIGLFPNFRDHTKISERIRKLLANIPHRTCSELLTYHAEPHEQNEIITIIQDLLKNVTS